MPSDKTSTLLSSTATTSSGPPWLLWLVGSVALHGLVYVGFTAVLQDRGGTPVPGQRNAPFTVTLEQQQQIAQSQQRYGYNPMQNAVMQPRLTPQQLAALTPEQRMQYLASQRRNRRAAPTLANARQSVAQLWKMRDEWAQVLEAQHAQYLKTVAAAQTDPLQQAKRDIAASQDDIVTAQRQQQRAANLMQKLAKAPASMNNAQKWNLRQEMLKAQKQAETALKSSEAHWKKAAAAMTFADDSLKTEKQKISGVASYHFSLLRLQQKAYQEASQAANLSPESPTHSSNLPPQFARSRAKNFPARQAEASKAVTAANRAMKSFVDYQKKLNKTLRTSKASGKATPLPRKALLPELPPVRSTPEAVQKQNAAELYNTAKELEAQIKRLDNRHWSYRDALNSKISIDNAIKRNGGESYFSSTIPEPARGTAGAELEQEQLRKVVDYAGSAEQYLERAQEKYNVNPRQARPLQAATPPAGRQPRPANRPQLTPQQQRLAREMLRRQMGFNSNSNSNSRPPRRTTAGQGPNRLGALPPTFAPPRRNSNAKFQPGRETQPWQPPKQPGGQRIKPTSSTNGPQKPGPRPSQPGSSPEGKLHGKPGSAPQGDNTNKLLQAIQGQTPSPEQAMPPRGVAPEANPVATLPTDGTLANPTPESNTQSTFGLTEEVQGPAGQEQAKPATPAGPEKNDGVRPPGPPAGKPGGNHRAAPPPAPREEGPGRRNGPPRPRSPRRGDERFGGGSPRPDRQPRQSQPQREPGNPGELSPEIIEQIRAAQQGSAQNPARPLSGSFGAGMPTLPPDFAKRLQEARQKQADNNRPGTGNPRTQAGMGVAGEARIPPELRGQRIYSDSVPPGVIPGESMKTIPGRKVLSDGVPGADWMFIDSWYTVGPFPNPNRANIHTAFAPEQGVDLDAVYTGKNNRSVRWQFVQTASPFLVPADPQEYAVYYAYTELWFDQAQELEIAVGSDDAGKLWINDKIVWQSSDALKPWRQAEEIVKVQFQKGRNRILYRVENGIVLVGMSLTISLRPGERRETGDGILRQKSEG